MQSLKTSKAVQIKYKTNKKKKLRLSRSEDTITDKRCCLLKGCHGCLRSIHTSVHVLIDKIEAVIMIDNSVKPINLIWKYGNHVFTLFCVFI